MDQLNDNKEKGIYKGKFYLQRKEKLIYEILWYATKRWNKIFLFTRLYSGHIQKLGYNLSKLS